MKKLAVLVLLLLLPNIALAKGAVGRSSAGRSSVRSAPRSSSRPATPKTTTPKTSTPKASTKPSSSTKKVTSTSNKVVSGKNYGKTGSIVGETYKPKFSGYEAPYGSTVYYQQSSMLDWLPFYLILTNQQHREAVVVEPAKDGQAQEKVVKEEGVDTMYVVNWVVTILFVVLIMALIVWFVNKKTND